MQEKSVCGGARARGRGRAGGGVIACEMRIIITTFFRSTNDAHAECMHASIFHSLISLAVQIDAHLYARKQARTHAPTQIIINVLPAPGLK